MFVAGLIVLVVVFQSECKILHQIAQKKKITCCFLAAVVVTVADRIVDLFWDARRRHYQNKCRWTEQNFVFILNVQSQTPHNRAQESQCMLGMLVFTQKPKRKIDANT